MSDRRGFGLLLGLGLAAYPRGAWGGGWTLEAGTGLVVVTDTLSRGVDIFNAARNLQSAPAYNKNELQALIEYGVTDRFTAILQPQLQHVDIGAPVDAHRTGLGYTELGGRLRVLQGDACVFSVQPPLRVPGPFDRSNPMALGYTDS